MKLLFRPKSSHLKDWNFMWKKIFEALSDFQNLLSFTGIILLVSTFLAPINTKWFELKLSSIQRVLVGILGVVLVALAVKTSLESQNNLELEFKYKSPISFSNFQQEAGLPGGNGASFCALTHVDDDNNDGSCSIRFDEDNNEWLALTGSDGGGNACEATCVWITVK